MFSWLRVVTSDVCELCVVAASVVEGGSSDKDVEAVDFLDVSVQDIFSLEAVNVFKRNISGQGLVSLRCLEVLILVEDSLVCLA